MCIPISRIGWVLCFLMPLSLTKPAPADTCRGFAVQESCPDIFLEKFHEGKKFDQAKLEDVLLWIHNDLTVFFVIDIEDFEKKGMKNIRDHRISLEIKKDSTLSSVLKIIGTDVGGEFRFEVDRDIRLSPTKNRKK